jgi:hypothetical protein
MAIKPMKKPRRHQGSVATAKDQKLALSGRQEVRRPMCSVEHVGEKN